ncbi:MAG: hypothetical protein HWE16_13925 [Gammaproteobacteria bacterium]|nr:hypothetical protein [Gammaproteobacteria bacterium]
MKKLAVMFALFFFLYSCNDETGKVTDNNTSQQNKSNDAVSIPKGNKKVRATLLGQWKYSEQEDDGKSVNYTLTLKDDGNFTLKKVTISPKGVKRTNFKKGLWGSESNVLFMLTHESGENLKSLSKTDLSLQKNISVYRLRKLNNNALSIRSVSKKQLLEYKKNN